MNKKIILPAFVLMVLAQLYVPANMIIDARRILTEGNEFKFKTAPIDPADPFRGKYIVLNFNASSAKVYDAAEWNTGDRVFVTLTTDSAGYAKIHDITAYPPPDTDDYVKADIQYIVQDTVSYVSVSYPFDRFYMEESKAFDAELAYNESAMDTNQIAYALVAVKKGEAAIKNVFINGLTIREAALEYQKRQTE